MLVEKFIWMYSATVELFVEPDQGEDEEEWLFETIEDQMIISSSDEFSLSKECIEIMKLKLLNCKHRDLKLRSLELLGKAVDLSGESDEGK